MKLWIDDLRPAPEGYVWCRDIDDAKYEIESQENQARWFSDRAYELERDGKFEFAKRMGKACQDNIIKSIEVRADTCDCVELIDWLRKTKRNYPIRTHSQNPVGVENMR